MKPWEMNYQQPKVVTNQAVIDIFEPETEAAPKPWEMQYSAPQMPSAPAAQSKGDGFIDRVGGALSKRGDMLEEINAANRTGQQTALETSLQQVGKVGAGSVLDVLGEGVVSAGRGLSYVTPDNIEKPVVDTVKAAGNAVMKSPVGDAMRYAGKEYGEFAKANPRAARNIESVANIAGVLTPVKAKPAGFADTLAGSSIKAATDVAKAPFKAGSAVKKALSSSVNTADDIRAQGDNAYKALAKSGSGLSSDFTNKWMDSLDAAKPKPIGGKVYTTEDRKFIDALDEFKDLRDGPLGLDDAQRIDEALGGKIDGSLDAGRFTKESHRLLDVQTTFRKMIDEAADADFTGGKEGFEALKEARQLWSKQAKLRDIEKIINRAKMTDNPASSIKTGFRNLASNENRLKRFSKVEQAAIRKAAESGVVSDTLRTLGSRLIPIVTMGMGGGLGATAAANIGSMASRSAATAMQLNRAGKVAEMIGGTKASPMAEALAKALIKGKTELPALLKNSEGITPKMPALSPDARKNSPER